MSKSPQNIKYEFYTRRVNDQSVSTRCFHCPLVLSLTAQEIEGLERPRKKRRRNSDSRLYSKARNEDTAQSEREFEIKNLESEKNAFVQRFAIK